MVCELDVQYSPKHGKSQAWGGVCNAQDYIGTLGKLGRSGEAGVCDTQEMIRQSMESATSCRDRDKINWPKPRGGGGQIKKPEARVQVQVQIQVQAQVRYRPGPGERRRSWRIWGNKMGPCKVTKRKIGHQPPNNNLGTYLGSLWSRTMPLVL